MLRRAPAVALPLVAGFACAVALGACGGDETPSAATLSQPPARTAPTTPPTATTTETTGTATAPQPATTTTAPPATTTQPSGGAPPTTPTTSTQPSGGAPAGCPNAVGGFIRDVRTSGIDCTAAREVATAWFDAIRDAGGPGEPITAAGYACSATLAGERASVTCTGGAGSVAFVASP